MARKKSQKVYYAYMDLKTSEIEVKEQKRDEKVVVTFPSLDEFCGSNGDKIIFINNLNILIKFLSGGEVGKLHRPSKLDSSVSEPTLYQYKNATFKSFSLMKPENMKAKELKFLFNTDYITDAMEKYVDMCGGPVGRNCISPTIAAQTKKMFYAPIEKEVRRDRNACQRYFNTKDMYYLCYSGCKSGYIKDVKNIELYDDCQSFDISSAYSSVMVNDDKFPVGRVKIAYDVDFIEELYKSGKWVKIIADGKVNDYSMYYDEKVDMTALEYYDIKTEMAFHGNNPFNIDAKCYLYCDRTDYLNDSFRNRVVEVYNEKSSLSKSDPKRMFVKQELEAIYGKGIQWNDFSEDNEVIAHYKKGCHYIQPHMANHCSAAIRYQIARVVYELDEGSVYWDTDGVKAKSSDFIAEYFDRLNDEIIEKNAKAGYPDCQIGTWHHEANCKKICLIRPKIYAYIDDLGLEMKFAGMDEDCKKICLKKTAKRGKDIFYSWKKDGFLFIKKILTIEETDELDEFDGSKKRVIKESYLTTILK